MRLNGIKDENGARQAMIEKIVQITRALKEDDFRETLKQSKLYENLRQHISGNFNIDTTPYDNIVKELVPGFFKNGF